VHDAGTESVRVCTAITSRSCECLGIESTDIAVLASSNATHIAQGGTVEFIVIVHNKRTRPATNVVLSFELPAGLRIASTIVASQGQCDPKADVCRLGPLPGGAKATMRVAATGLLFGEHETVFSATEAEVDMTMKDNSAVVKTVVVQ
jgi:uncharacterized repeat protein (TIGR01451 family)